MKCANSEMGCKWEGTLGSSEGHATSCECTLLPCPRQCRDHDDKVRHYMKKNLDDHLSNGCPNREVECTYCGAKTTHAELTDHQQKSCAKKLVPCPNIECPVTLFPGETQRHVRTECEFTELSCKYKGIGCDVKMKRRDMPGHEENDDKHHLRRALDAILDLRRERDIERCIRAREESMTFKLVEFGKKREANIKFMSPSFYTSERGYNLTIRVDANGNSEASGSYVSIFALFIEGKHDSELAWPFVGNITFTLLNQLEDDNHIENTLKFGVANDVRPKDIGRGVLRFAPHSELGHNPVRNTQYLKDDTLYFRVAVSDIPSYKPWLHCTVETL